MTYFMVFDLCCCCCCVTDPCRHFQKNSMEVILPLATKWPCKVKLTHRTKNWSARKFQTPSPQYKLKLNSVQAKQVGNPSTTAAVLNLQHEVKCYCPQWQSRLVSVRTISRFVVGWLSLESQSQSPCTSPHLTSIA